MGIVGNLFIELKKHKRRCNLLLFIALIVAEMAFLYGNFHEKEAASAGWMLLFYNIPIINCVFFPVAIAGFASRLMDIEHKGEMLKCLYTFPHRKRSFSQNIFMVRYAHLSWSQCNAARSYSAAGFLVLTATSRLNICLYTG